MVWKKAPWFEFFPWFWLKTLFSPDFPDRKSLQKFPWLVGTLKVNMFCIVQRAIGFGIRVRLRHSKWAITVTNHRCHRIKCNLNDQGQPFVRNQKKIVRYFIRNFAWTRTLFGISDVLTGFNRDGELWRISKPPPPPNFLHRISIAWVSWLCFSSDFRLHLWLHHTML